MMGAHTLRWRDNIVTSVRIPDGWVEVRGDVLEAGEHDCVSVRQVSLAHDGEAWCITHLGTGSRIVCMPDAVSARLVAEEIVATAPEALWGTASAPMAAELLRDVLTPILAGRRCFFKGKWRGGR
jgi:hypothetical protein